MIKIQIRKNKSNYYYLKIIKDNIVKFIADNDTKDVLLFSTISLAKCCSDYEDIDILLDTYEEDELSKTELEISYVEGISGSRYDYLNNIIINSEESKKSRKNQICKECSTPFHYCGSCGFDSANSNGFCSSECLNKNSYSTVELFNNIEKFEFNQVFINTYDEYEYLIFKGKYFSYYDIVDEKEVFYNIEFDKSWTKCFIEKD